MKFIVDDHFKYFKEGEATMEVKLASYQ